jgi:hypothetical protein
MASEAGEHFLEAELQADVVELSQVHDHPAARKTADCAVNQRPPLELMATTSRPSSLQTTMLNLHQRVAQRQATLRRTSSGRRVECPSSGTGSSLSATMRDEMRAVVFGDGDAPALSGHQRHSSEPRVAPGGVAPCRAGAQLWPFSQAGKTQKCCETGSASTRRVATSLPKERGSR